MKTSSEAAAMSALTYIYLRRGGLGSGVDGIVVLWGRHEYDTHVSSG